jgi:hypothetical protein
MEQPLSENSGLGGLGFRLSINHWILARATLKESWRLFGLTCACGDVSKNRQLGRREVNGNATH